MLLLIGSWHALTRSSSFQEPDSAQELEKMRDVVLGVSDRNKDGKLSRAELALLLSDMDE